MKQNLRQCLANGIVLAAIEYGKSRDQTRAKLDQRYKDYWSCLTNYLLGCLFLQLRRDNEYPQRNPISRNFRILRLFGFLKNWGWVS